ncbi:50S ribosomal protein L29 [Patescibacteria group bacterium]|jgi:ribosomal protein L29|nr:50S ribosomal protein L29 [Patescibacteria group bacterium]MDQ5919660.1 Ribosomal protein [Patescibacteria group bacterium]
MLAKDLSQKSAEELKALAGELEAKLREARFNIATRQMKNVSAVNVIRRDLARVKHAQALISQPKA